MSFRSSQKRNRGGLIASGFIGLRVQGLWVSEFCCSKVGRDENLAKMVKTENRPSRQSPMPSPRIKKQSTPPGIERISCKTQLPSSSAFVRRTRPVMSRKLGVSIIRIWLRGISQYYYTVTIRGDQYCLFNLCGHRDIE